MWMSGKWYGCENRLRTRKNMNDAFTLINEGTIVSICDDVVIVKDEDE